MLNPKESVFDRVNLIAKRNGIVLDNFVQKRRQAQTFAASKGLLKLHDIYMCFEELFGLKQEDCCKLEECELEAENELCVLNSTMSDLMNFLIEHDKKYIFISDMHLSNRQLSDLLRNKGVPIDDDRIVHVSCEYKESISTGRLFYEVQKTYPNGTTILHIGDSLKSDYLRPKFISGFQSVHVPRVEGDILSKMFFANLSVNTDLAYKWGYSFVAPVLWLFCKWVEKNALQHSFDKILFLTREGSFFKKLFDISRSKDFPIPYEVLYASRRSIALFSLEVNWDVAKQVAYNVCDSYKDIKDLFSIPDEKWNPCLQKNYINEEDKWNKDEYILEDLKETILEEGDKRTKIFVSYLSQLYDSTVKNIGMVDVGWSGTSQLCLQKFLKSINPSVNICGLYFAVLNDKNPKDKKYGFVSSPSENKYELQVANAGFIFENIFLDLIGQTVGYIQNKDNTIEPILNTSLVFEDETIKRIQSAIFDFFNDYKKVEEFGVIHHDICINKLLNTLNYPSGELANMLGDIKWADSEKNIQYISKPSYNLLWGLLHFRKLIRDINKCGWKSGFCRRMFKIPFPYAKLYFLYKRLGK